jgi:hypothetical protein
VVERPILFSAPMVRAILGGLKTQTRRIAKGAPHHEGDSWEAHMIRGQACFGDRANAGTTSETFNFHMGEEGELPALRPPIAKGDSIWVRETLKRRADRRWVYGADGAAVSLPAGDPRIPEMTAWAHHKLGNTCVSIHMPRWASRVILEVVDVRIERLQDCSSADAEAEGVREPSLGDMVWSGMFGVPRTHCAAVTAYAVLWDDINGDDAWSANPWVWVYTFKRVQP